MGPKDRGREPRRTVLMLRSLIELVQLELDESLEEERFRMVGLGPEHIRELQLGFSGPAELVQTAR